MGIGIEIQLCESRRYVVRHPGEASLLFWLLAAFAAAAMLIAASCGSPAPGSPSSSTSSAQLWAAGSKSLSTNRQVGRIFSSSDGGIHWRLVAQKDHLGFTKIAVAGARHLWVIGGVEPNIDPPPGHILASSDGGATWTDQDDELGMVLGVATTSASTALAVGDTDGPMIPGPADTLIIKTSDGGSSWSQEPQLPRVATAPQPAVTSSLGVYHQRLRRGRDRFAKGVGSAVAFGDAAHGWIITDTPTGLLATSDGGESWHTQSLLLGKDALLEGLTAVDATHAWIVGISNVSALAPPYAPMSPLILATSDGRHWVAQEAPAKFNLLAVAFADRLHGWAVGASRSEILATSNGGATWTKQHVPAGADPRGFVSVTASDPLNVWAVSGSAVFATSDGGTTWRVIAKLPADLSAVAAVVKPAH